MSRLTNKLTLIILLTIVLIPSTVEAANKHYTIFIDGEGINFINDMGYPQKTSTGRTLIPIRAVAEEMGYQVGWLGHEKRISISDNKSKIELQVGKNTAQVNGKTVTLDTKAQVIDDKTYLPLRFISEAMGSTIEYRTNPHAHYIYITRPGSKSIAPAINQTIPDMGKIPGIAQYTKDGSVENIKKISHFFGAALDEEMSNSGMASFNPIGGGTDGSFLYVVDRPGEDCEALVVVKDWYMPESHIGIPTEKEYRMLNPTIKEVLRFYLPNGYDKLYQIIDDGMYFRWDHASNYVGKDLSKMIGSDKKVVLIDGDGGLRIEIGVGR